MENKIIKVFDTEEYLFLSNFYPYRQNLPKESCSFVVEYDGIEFDCVEKAYQAAKCAKRADRFQFQDLTALQAQKLGTSQQIIKREDWSEIKFRLMYEFIWQKFSFCEELHQKLLATDNSRIIAENNWGDIYWGVCHGVGDNYLGEILMRVRNAIK